MGKEKRSRSKDQILSIYKSISHLSPPADRVLDWHNRSYTKGQ